MTKKKKMLLGLDPDLDFALDCFLAEHNHFSKSAFIRDAIRARLKELTKPIPEPITPPPPRPNRVPKHPTLQEQWAAELEQENERRRQQSLIPEHPNPLDEATRQWLN